MSILSRIRLPTLIIVVININSPGNNVWGEDICRLLTSLGDSVERNAYILMERIQPAPLDNYVIRPGQPLTLQTLVSELGIFGVVVG